MRRTGIRRQPPDGPVVVGPIRPGVDQAFGDYWGGGPVTHHHDKGRVWDAAAGRYSGYGINGRQLLIDRTPTP